jgi:hypothetical protein
MSRVLSRDAVMLNLVSKWLFMLVIFADLKSIKLSTLKSSCQRLNVPHDDVSKIRLKAN